MDYMGKGGFPEGIRSGERFHRALLNDILNKDISARYRIKFTKELNELALLLLSNISREISYSRLKGPVGIRNVHTVKSYLQYLESSYLFFQVSRFSRKLKEQYLAPRKIYCIDTGLVSSIAFATSRNTGHLMENIVSVELQRRKALDPSMDVFYWKDHRGREVDFVVLRKGEVKELIQVTFDIDQLDIRDRELSALNGGEKELECSRKTIITFDREGKRGDARMVPLWKWLLGLGDE
jgi:predicted AAA+ superfamily ATPase